MMGMTTTSCLRQSATAAQWEEQCKSVTRIHHDGRLARVEFLVRRSHAYRRGLDKYSGDKNSARIYARRPFAAW